MTPFDPQLTKQHFKANIFLGYLRYLERHYPAASPEEICRSVGLSYAYFQEPDNWVSVAVESRLMAQCAEIASDPDLSYRVGQFAASREVAGDAIYSLIRYVLPLPTVLRTLPKLIGHFNRVMRAEVIGEGRGRIEIRYWPIFDRLSAAEAEMLKASLPNILANTAGYFSQLPAIKGLRPAEVETELADASFLIRIRYEAPRLGQAFWAWALPPAAAIVFLALIDRTAWGVLPAILSALGVLAAAAAYPIARRYRELSQVARDMQKNMAKLDAQYKMVQWSREELGRKLEQSRTMNAIIHDFAEVQQEGELVERSVAIIAEHMGFDRVMIFIADREGAVLNFGAARGFAPELVEAMGQLSLPVAIADDDPHKISNVFSRGRPILVSDVRGHLKTLKDPASRGLLQASGSRSFVAVPIATERNRFGVALADYSQKAAEVTLHDRDLLSTVGKQLASALEKLRVTQAYSRFVPWESLKLLNYDQILDVRLGDCHVQELTILFSDIRAFTSLMETMSETEAIGFLNSYWGAMAPIVNRHGGIIDAYIGDCVMGLFHSPQQAVDCAVAMQRALVVYNSKHRTGRGFVDASVGLHRGTVVAAPLGHADSMSITVVSDAVNTASRIDSLNKAMGSQILVSEDVMRDATLGPSVRARPLGCLRLRGKKERIGIVEICDFAYFDELPPTELPMREDLAVYQDEMRRRLEAKFHAPDQLSRALAALNDERYQEATERFERLLRFQRDDPALSFLLSYSQQMEAAAKADTADPASA